MSCKKYINAFRENLYPSINSIESIHYTYFTLQEQFLAFVCEVIKQALKRFVEVEYISIAIISCVSNFFIAISSFDFFIHVGALKFGVV